jgi:hypothetical protein
MTSQLSKPDTDLLPCPFCGGEAEFAGYAHEPDCYVYCGNDNCFGPRTTAGNLHDAAIQWNTRAAVRAQGQPNELAGRLEKYARDVSNSNLGGSQHTCDCDEAARLLRTFQLQDAPAQGQPDDARTREWKTAVEIAVRMNNGEAVSDSEVSQLAESVVYFDETADAQLQAKLHCVCGSPIDHAPDGHSPISMYDHALDQAEEENARLNKLVEALHDNGLKSFPPQESPDDRCSADMTLAHNSRTAAIEEIIRFIEDGSFLHDDAPPKRFARELVAAIRDRLLPDLSQEVTTEINEETLADLICDAEERLGPGCDEQAIEQAILAKYPVRAKR